MAAALALFFGVLAVLGLRWLVVAGVNAEAARRGVHLQQCEFDLSWSSVVVSGCQFETLRGGSASQRLPGSLTLSGTLGRVEAWRNGWSLERVRVSGARTTLAGSASLVELLRVLARSAPVRPEDAATPVELQGLVLSWEPIEGMRVAIAEGAYDSAVGRYGGQLTLGERLSGRVSGAPGRFDLELGAEAPTLEARVQAAGGESARARLSMSLRHFPLRALSVFGVGSAATNPAVVEGQVSVEVPLGLATQQPSGRFDVTFEGLELPPPPELPGLRLTTSPEVSGRLRPSRSLRSAQLEGLEVRLGAFTLRGGGSVTRQGLEVPFRLSLRGPLACRSIANAVGSRDDGPLARLAQRIVRQGIAGKVDVVVVVAGDARTPEHAKSFTSAGFGCGLDGSRIESVRLPRELLAQLPPQWRERVPERIELPRVPALRLPRLDELRLPTFPILPSAKRPMTEADSAGP